MTYVYETVMGGKNLVVEYCYSSLDNKIKVVEMTVDGKFHRVNWMSNEGRDSLMSQLMKDYDGVMFGQQDSDVFDMTMASYDSEIDLDRDVPSLMCLGQRDLLCLGQRGHKSIVFGAEGFFLCLV